MSQSSPEEPRSVCPDRLSATPTKRASWVGFSAIQIKGVTFGNESSPTSFAAVSDQGGKAEVLATCSAFGGPFCIYPWYTLGAIGFHYGIDYPDTLRDFKQADQFSQTLQCRGPFGANSTYCATTLINERQ